MKTYAGIDPGASGAIASVDFQGTLLKYEPYKNWTQAGNFLKVLKEESHNNLLVGLEKVSSLRGNGIKSTFSFGANFGGWISALEILEIPYVLVSPAAWMPKTLGKFEKGKSKEAALKYVARRYPMLDLRKKDHGIADSLCIALFVIEHK